MVREMGEGEGARGREIERKRGMQAERDRWERDGAPPVRTKTLVAAFSRGNTSYLFH